MPSYTFYKDTFKERISICTADGISEEEAINTAAKDVQQLLNEYETQHFIKRGTVDKIKRELEIR